MANNRLSRRKIAIYFADELLAGRSVFEQLAAYLLDSKQTRELSLVVRDVEAALADRGVLLADVVSAHELNVTTEKAITDHLKKATGAETVYLRPQVDTTLLGGVRIETPDERLDATLRHRLNQLTASKI